MSGGKSQRPPWLGEVVDRRRWDHVRIHVQLLQDDRLGAFHLATYMGLAVHADGHTGDAHPSAVTLGGYANMSERTARRAIEDLESWGYLAVEHRKGQASVYRLLPPPVIEEPRTQSPTSPGGDPGQGQPEPRTPTTPTPDGQSDELDRNEITQELTTVAGDDGTVERLCSQLADGIATWGLRPTVSAGWRRDMDLLLRVDGRSPDDVARVIAWLTVAGDEVSSFWRSNIRSPRKLRSQWDTMADRYRNMRERPKTSTAARNAAAAANVRQMFAGHPEAPNRKAIG